MTKDELITKQQIEIEELKLKLEENAKCVSDAIGHLWRPEQWSIKCPDFPKVAMRGIVEARRSLNDLAPE